MASILIVDDEAKMARLLELQLAQAGYATLTAGSAELGLRQLRQQPPDLLLTDLRLPGMDGLAFLRAAREELPSLPVVVMTAHGTIETAVEAMKAGASDYLLKPFAMEEMRLVIAKELDVQSLREQNRALRAALAEKYDFPNIIGRSRRMREALDLVERVAATNTTVLLLGESGVGKDLFAHALHQRSRRASGPFIKINSAAIPETLLESELFGYEKGAFTGAYQAKPGRLEMAGQGTLILDEIAAISLPLQAKLLRVIEEKRFERLGGHQSIEIEARLVALTNVALDQAVAQRTFREDLYYRLFVLPLQVPPLRERRGDILPLAEYFLATLPNARGAKLKPAARAALAGYGFPGNVRELRNLLCRALIWSAQPALTLADFPDYVVTGPATGATLQSLDEVEKQHIAAVLDRCRGRKQEAARQLGISPKTLLEKRRKYGLDLPWTDRLPEGVLTPARRRAPPLSQVPAPPHS
ncbi:MAG: sigma-54-dependent transcriptional regulator [Terriglobales bacterium]